MAWLYSQWLLAIDKTESERNVMLKQKVYALTLFLTFTEQHRLVSELENGTMGYRQTFMVG